MDESQTQAILQAPWRTHSAELRRKIIANCRHVHMCDGGYMEKIDGRWVCTQEGGLADWRDFYADAQKLQNASI